MNKLVVLLAVSPLLLPRLAFGTNELTWQTSPNNAPSQTSAAVQSANEWWMLAEGLAGNTGAGQPGGYTGTLTGAWRIVQSEGAGPNAGPYLTLTANGVTHYVPLSMPITTPGTVTATDSTQMAQDINNIAVAIFGYGQTTLKACTCTAATCSTITAPSNCNSNGGARIAITSVAGTTFSINGDVTTLAAYNFESPYSPTSATWSQAPVANYTGAYLVDALGPSGFGASNVAVGTSWVVLQSPMPAALGCSPWMSGGATGCGTVQYAVFNYTSATLWAASFGRSISSVGTNTNAPVLVNALTSQITDAWNNGTITNQHYMHWSISQRGDFCFYEHYSTEHAIYSVLCFVGIQDNPTAQDAYLGAVIRAGGGNIAGRLTAGGWSTSPGTSAPYNWSAPNGSGSATNYQQVLVTSAAANGSPATASAALPLLYEPWVGSGFADAFPLTTSGYLSGTDSITLGYDNLPIYVIASSGGSSLTLKGRLPDITWAPASVNPASVGGTPSQVIDVGGAAWFPWTSSALPTS